MVGQRNITLHCWCQRKWEPFLHGSSLHPEEPLRKKRALISSYCRWALRSYWITLPTTYFSSPTPRCSGLHSTPARIMLSIPQQLSSLSMLPLPPSPLSSSPLLPTFLHWLDADRGERESRDWQTKIFKLGLDLKLRSGKNENSKSHFRLAFWLHWTSNQFTRSIRE